MKGRIWLRVVHPRASPWAIISRPFRADGIASLCLFYSPPSGGRIGRFRGPKTNGGNGSLPNIKFPSAVSLSVGAVREPPTARPRLEQPRPDGPAPWKNQNRRRRSERGSAFTGLSGAVKNSATNDFVNNGPSPPRGAQAVGGSRTAPTRSPWTTAN